MKTKITLLVSSLLTLCSQAATWTFHGFKDNWSAVQLMSSQSLQCQPYWGYRQWWEIVYWDYGWDIANPGSEDSGFQSWTNTCDTGSTQLANAVVYQDLWQIESSSDVGNLWVYISGPYPDYNGFSQQESSTIPGEYWIDFASDGTFRISTSQPSDFGKWAWDGSVNPNWVEPLAAKKQHGKGHK